MEKNNIVLIGMPGAGKSTLGVVLAKALGKQFIDTDLLIQEQTGKRLQDIINKNGIDGFLSVEEKVVSALNCENSVIATGGSVVLLKKAMENLQKNGVIVFLDVPLDELKLRINNITTRGIVMSKDENINSVFEKRFPLYNAYSDITVDAKNGSFEKTIEQIICKVSK